MLKSENKRIIMDEGDYGINLPFKISGDVSESDKFLFIIKKDHNQEEIIRKEYSNLSKDEEGKLSFDLCFDKEESMKLPVGYYIYIIRQCRDCELHNTIERNGEFQVKEGAGE